MKIFLDDERETPPGWRRTISSFGTVSLLKIGLFRDYEEVTDLSLDHDLGVNKRTGKLLPTGYEVLLWIEEQVITNQYVPPKITIHSANPSAREKMLLAVQQIEKYHKLNVDNSTRAQSKQTYKAQS